MGNKSSRSRREEETEAESDDGDVETAESVPAIQPRLQLGWMRNGTEETDEIAIRNPVDSPFETVESRDLTNGDQDSQSSSTPTDSQYSSAIANDNGSTGGPPSGVEAVETQSSQEDSPSGIAGHYTADVSDTTGPVTDQQYQQRYGVSITRPAQADTLDRLAETNGEEQVREWAKMGMPVEAMASPETRRRFREREGTPVPWDVESYNEESRRRNLHQPKDAGPAGETRIPDVLRRVISEPGQSPPESLQREFAERMDDSAADVQIHSGVRATAAAESLAARALTVGNHVVFNREEYDHQDTTGGGLLEHELSYLRRQSPDDSSLLPKETAELPAGNQSQFERSPKNAFSERSRGRTVPHRGMDLHVQHSPERRAEVFERSVDRQPGAAGIERAIRHETAALADVARPSAQPALGAQPKGAETGGMASNTSVESLYAAGQIQADLEVSSPNEPAEREAESVAEQVMGMDTPATEAEGHEPPSIRQSPKDDSSGKSLSDDHEQALRSSLTSGKPLPGTLRSYYEHRFGQGFSDVRIHTGSQADAAARSIDATAFTLGSDIVFQRGHYRPTTSPGKHLLAHELAHVVQQEGGTPELQRSADERSHGDVGWAQYRDWEREAMNEAGLGLSTFSQYDWPLDDLLPSWNEVESSLPEDVSHEYAGRGESPGELGGQVEPEHYQVDLIFNLPINTVPHESHQFNPNYFHRGEGTLEGGGLDQYISNMIESRYDNLPGENFDHDLDDGDYEWSRMFYVVGFTDHVGGDSPENKQLGKYRGKFVSDLINKIGDYDVGMGELGGRGDRQSEPYRFWGSIHPERSIHQEPLSSNLVGGNVFPSDHIEEEDLFNQFESEEEPVMVPRSKIDEVTAGSVEPENIDESRYEGDMIPDIELLQHQYSYDHTPAERAVNRSVAIFDMIFKTEQHEWGIISETLDHLEERIENASGDEETDYKIYQAYFKAWASQDHANEDERIESNQVDFTFWPENKVNAVAESPHMSSTQIDRIAIDGKPSLTRAIKSCTDAEEVIEELATHDTVIEKGLTRFDEILTYPYPPDSFPASIQRLEHKMNVLTYGVRNPDDDEEPRNDTLYGIRDKILKEHE